MDSYQWMNTFINVVSQHIGQQPFSFKAVSPIQLAQFLRETGKLTGFTSSIDYYAAASDILAGQAGIRDWFASFLRHATQFGWGYAQDGGWDVIVDELLSISGYTPLTLPVGTNLQGYRVTFPLMGPKTIVNYMPPGIVVDVNVVNSEILAGMYTPLTVRLGLSTTYPEAPAGSFEVTIRFTPGNPSSVITLIGQIYDPVGGTFVLNTTPKGCDVVIEQSMLITNNPLRNVNLRGWDRLLNQLRFFPPNP